MSPFERKFGKYAIKNLSFILVLCYGVGYLLQMMDRSNMLLSFLTLNPYPWNGLGGLTGIMYICSRACYLPFWAVFC